MSILPHLEYASGKSEADGRGLMQNALAGFKTLLSGHGKASANPADYPPLTHEVQMHVNYLERGGK